MRMRTWLAGAVACVVVTAVGAAGCGADTRPPSNAGASPTNPSEGGAPAEVTGAATDWPVANRDYGGTRSTTDSPIDAATVGGLEVAWTTDLPGTGTYGNASTTPLVLGDTAYLETLSGHVLAVDVTDGSVRWDADVSDKGLPMIGPNGVAVGDGLVFAVAGSNQIAALDLTTGHKRWATTITATSSLGIDIQPVTYGGLVYASTVPISLGGVYRGGDAGVIQALDTATGRVVWTFDTVDSADLWGNPAVNSGGGAWYPPAIDPERGLMYWGTGNPGPFPGTPDAPSGSSRPGPNLYTDSVVALDLATGALRWYHQVTPHDLFDHDQQFALLAATAQGTTVISTGKSGLVLGLDPDTGDVRWQRAVGLHANEDLTTVNQPTEVAPGTLGGVIAPPATANGIIYVAVNNEPTVYQTTTEQNLSGAPVGQHDGEVVAIDAATGEVVWDVHVPGDPFGGATVVNDLVFTGLHDGTLMALSTATGAPVWSHKAEGIINGWPAVAGDLLIWPLGSAAPSQLLALRTSAPSTTDPNTTP